MTNCAYIGRNKSACNGEHENNEASNDYNSKYTEWQRSHLHNRSTDAEFCDPNIHWILDFRNWWRWKRTIQWLNFRLSGGTNCNRRFSRNRNMFSNNDQHYTLGQRMTCIVATDLKNIRSSRPRSSHVFFWRAPRPSLFGKTAYQDRSIFYWCNIDECVLCDDKLSLTFILYFVFWWFSLFLSCNFLFRNNCSHRFQNMRKQPLS